MLLLPPPPPHSHRSRQIPTSRCASFKLVSANLGLTICSLFVEIIFSYILFCTNCQNCQSQEGTLSSDSWRSVVTGTRQFSDIFSYQYKCNIITFVSIKLQTNWSFLEDILVPKVTFSRGKAHNKHNKTNK